MKSPPHELPEGLGLTGGLNIGRFAFESGTEGIIPPTPRIVNRYPRIRLVIVVRGLWRVSRWRPPCPGLYGVGSGLSWKPIAAAFRSSDFNALAFILASYSSIDCVTYSWPYLSIL